MAIAPPPPPIASTSLEASETSSTSTSPLDSTPPRTLLLENLNTQTALITALFTLLASPNPNNNSISALASLHLSPEIQQLILAHQAALSGVSLDSGNSNSNSNAQNLSKSLSQPLAGRSGLGLGLGGLAPSLGPGAGSGSTPQVAPGQNSSHLIEAIYSALRTTTHDLQSIRKHLSQHQRTWARVEAKKAEVMILEQRVKGLIRGLERGKGELEGLVKSGREVVKGIEKVQEAPIPAPSLLAHAHALSRHSSAPLSSLLTPIDRAAYMPWPTEGAMRMGLLFQMQGSMSGVGLVEAMGFMALTAGTTNGDIEMADGTGATGGGGASQAEVHREESGRRYDPDAIYSLDLNSDSEDE